MAFTAAQPSGRAYESDRKPRLFVGVTSCASNAGRRAGCLATWLHDASTYDNIDFVFVLGSSDLARPIREGHVLHVPCPDDYASLPQKTRWLCSWALANRPFDRLLKCDDDTYVCLERLAELDGPAPYVGADIGGYASGGAGYLLNREAAGIISSCLVEAAGCEDMLVGKTLVGQGIQLAHDDRFKPWAGWNDVPRPGNALITGHSWQPDSMAKIHKMLWPGKCVSGAGHTEARK